MRIGAFLNGLLFGSCLGLALGVLTAPKTGRQMRREIADASDTFYRKAAYEMEELAQRLDELTEHVEKLKANAPASVRQAMHQAQHAVEDFNPSAKQHQVDEAVEVTQHSQELLQHTRVPGQQAEPQDQSA